MNKKKILALLVTTTLLAVVAVGSTLAYFTDKTKTFENVVTMGRVEGRLIENDIKKDDITKKWVINDTAKPIITKGLDYTGIIPGDTIVKNPTVHLMPGSADAWVRVKIDVVGGAWLDNKVNINGKEQCIRDFIIESMDINDEDWHHNFGSNRYYYEYRLTAPDGIDEESNYLNNLVDTQTKATLFNTFSLPVELDNRGAKQTFTIKVEADLIQADYVELKQVYQNGIPWKVWKWCPLNSDEIIDDALIEDLPSQP